MGIIAGIQSNVGQEVLVEQLKAMIQCQSHRDKQTPIIHTTSNLAIGMANKHDSIFCNGSETQMEQAQIKSNGIHAFVDGIVLEVPKHKFDLEGHGLKIPVPLCSSIVEAAYERWGLDFMAHLEGEFACVIWDEKEKRVVLARDPYGHKPVHYTKDHNQFVFSSEIKGILAAGVDRQVDLVSLSDFLSLNCIPYPATIFKDIYQVPPGSILIYEKGAISIKSYWSPILTENKALGFDDAVDALSEKIKTAVKKRMVSDETYCFLSGGIDSSAIVSFASEISGKPIHAVSVGFEEAEANEIEDAERMAKHVGAEHHKIIAKPDSFFEMLDTLVFHHDSPFSDTSAYPTYYAGKLASGFTDLILTGDGPDQSMGGSSHHVFALANRTFDQKPKWLQSVYGLGAQFTDRLSKDPTPSIISKINRRVYRDSLSPVRAAYDLRSYFPNIVKKYMCTEEILQVHRENDPFRHPEAWFGKFKGIDAINQYLYADMNFYVPDDLMIKVDRMSMAHGLETLSPFQDIAMASLVNQMPRDYKIRSNSDRYITTKYILKKCCDERFPKATLEKRKQGFGIPLDKWLKKDNGKVLREIALSDKAMNRGYFKKAAIKNMVDVFLSGNGDYYFPGSNMIAAFLTFELWNRRYMD